MRVRSYSITTFLMIIHEFISAADCFQINRRQLIGSCTSSLVASNFILPSIVNAFDGSGASAYSGRNPLTTKAEQRKNYQDRIVADVRDFNTLGNAIDKGMLDGDAWVNFFIEYQRRDPDAVGRTYAALADLIGNKDTSGCGYLLATSFAKAGKPSDGLPSVKKYNTMVKAFEPIKAAGAKGDLKKAKSSWTNAGVVLSDFLNEVGLPKSLTDEMYM